MDESDGQPNGHSGITLVLPSLRALKAANAGKKSNEQRPKIPRPVKLKPLKEVLTKLVTQIKKKDDYAFFIHPVDPTKVPGYADVIKHPMDLGTMTVKVTRGKYRSLDEFTNDFRLVTANAKTFNPPGSIYHTEADRLEAWGLDHIVRASAHVIEYETDWNIDVEQDEDVASQHVNVEDDVSTPMDVEGSLATGSRAPSTTPGPVQAQAPVGQGRRGPRGPYKRHQTQTTLSESLDPEGRMPGAKDGVAVFPAGSDWAELMIALKIKGKRYKTKKERLRFEKEGPPCLPDGSLDYAEMEDPFSVLNVFAPDPPSRPQVTPLYPPSNTTMTEGPRSQTHGLRICAPVPITVPPDRPPPVLSTVSNLAPPPPAAATTAPPPPRPPKKRRHWTIVRNVPVRSRAKDKDGDATADESKPGWKVPREAGPGDYGTFATFLGELAASAQTGAAVAVDGRTGPGAGAGAVAQAAAAEYVYGSDDRLFATIRSTVAHRPMKRKREVEEGEEEKEVWTDEQAEEGWDYLRDVVYGGVDGYAYVRSLAEFVAPSVYFDDECRERDGLPLGVPLARYVEDNLVDMVTRGRHGWLRDGLFSVPFEKWNGDLTELVQEPEELTREGVLEGGRVACALAWSAGAIEELGRRAGDVKEEDDLVRRVRLNLLALAKRAQCA